jgi:carbonic anhydrase/acetyltransferase-like protein (isoleucine patch superfamily)
MSKIHKSVYVAEGSVVKGDVEVGEDSSIWYHAVVRADSDQIRIGKRTNIQDNVVVHTDAGFPVTIGEGVTIGHNAVIHGCSIGDNTLIGMGAIVLNGTKIGKNCLIGAGALVTGGSEIPDGSLVIGNPGKIRRVLRDEEIEGNRSNAAEYVTHAKAEMKDRAN